MLNQEPPIVFIEKIKQQETFKTTEGKLVHDLSFSLFDHDHDHDPFHKIKWGEVRVIAVMCGKELTYKNSVTISGFEITRDPKSKQTYNVRYNGRDIVQYFKDITLIDKIYNYSYSKIVYDQDLAEQFLFYASLTVPKDWVFD